METASNFFTEFILAYKIKLAALVSITLITATYAFFLLHEEPMADAIRGQDRASALGKDQNPPKKASSHLLPLNLFGKFKQEEAALDVSKLPSSKLSFELAGIIGSTFLRDSRCLIAESGKPAKSYFAGDKLAGNIEIYRIDKDAVILKRGEILEKLELHQSGSGRGQSQSTARRLSPAAAITETVSTAAPITTGPDKPVYKDLEDRIAAIRKKSKI